MSNGCTFSTTLPCLLEETYIVDVTLQSVCHPNGRTGKCTDTDGGEHKDESVVDIERTAVVSLTDDEHAVMPVAVSQIRRSELIHIACRKADNVLVERELHRDGVAHSGTEEGYLIRRSVIAPEPTHEGVVLGLGAREERRLQAHLVTVGSKRYALRIGPRESLGGKCSTGGEIVHRVTLALRERIVGQQSVLIAGEATKVGVGYLSRAESFRP